MRFRPQFWPTLMTIPMLVVLFGLGSWQLVRHEWKTDLIAQLQQRAEAPAVSLPANLDSAAEMEFTAIRVAGTFLNDKELHLIGRSLRGNPGIHVLTPFRRADGKGFELVDRGWVPFDRRAPETRGQGQLDGVVVVEGIIRLARGQGWFVPENDSAGNTWYFIDPEAMAAAGGVDALPPYYIVSSDQNVPGGYPVGRQWRLNIANNHMEYAITWFLLAVSLIVIYVVYHRQQTE